MTIKFGTEGWRAVMADEFTMANVRVVTQAIADHFTRTHAGAGRHHVTMAVGYDTRFLSDQFARAVAEVLTANQIHVDLTKDAIPTPALSRYVVHRRLSAGVMVTASHNPAIYNGIKVKASYGGSATTEAVTAIEQRLGRSPIRQCSLDEAHRAGLVQIVDMWPAFLNGIRSFIDVKAIRRSPFRVVADAMHGAAGRTIEQLLRGGRCRVETLHAEADPRFGGQAPEPIASHLTALRRAVVQQRADVGIATDGDADRLGMIGSGGRWLNPGQVMCVLLMHLVNERRMRGTVVKTVSNTMMINRVTEALGLRLLEVPVGFKYVVELMLTDDVLIGGEESGGIGITSYLPERDGIVNGLLVLEAMALRRRTLSAMVQDLERRYGHWHYGRRDLHLTISQVDALFKRLHRAPPEQIGGTPVTQVNTLDGVKLIGRDESWLLFRRSGTEPMVRIYAESPHQRRLAALLALGVRLTQRR